jgi:hypothetical protein
MFFLEFVSNMERIQPIPLAYEQAMNGLINFILEFVVSRFPSTLMGNP